MNRGAWKVTVHVVAKSQTQPSNTLTHIRTHTYAHTLTHMHTHITRRRKALLQQKTFHHMFAGVSSVSDCSGVCFSGFLILYILTIYWMADNLNDRLLVARFCHTYL